MSPSDRLVQKCMEIQSDIVVGDDDNGDVSDIIVHDHQHHNHNCKDCGSFDLSAISIWSRNAAKFSVIKLLCFSASNMINNRVCLFCKDLRGPHMSSFWGSPST